MKYYINENGIIENCQLSENLSLYDLIKSELGRFDIRQITELLSINVVQNLELLAQNVIEPIIQQVGYLPTITRCLYLQYGRNVHLRQFDYAHMFGHAVDLMVSDDIVCMVKSLEKIDFDLVLYDYSSLHIQYYTSGNRNAVFKVRSISQYEAVNEPLSDLESYILYNGNIMK